MGCTVRERNLRNYRKLRSALRPDADYNASVERIPVPRVFPPELSLKPSSDHHHHDVDVEHNNRNPNPSLDECGWGYCTEEQLEELLLKNLQFLYNEAVAKLVALGYDEDVALKAILRNGHCYGGMDVLTNILHNSLAYLNSSVIQEPHLSYKELKQLEEYSLAGMICLLQQVKPHLSKGDAMWCLLMSDLHVGRASTMEIPVLPSSSNSNGPNTVSNGPNTVSNGPNTVSNGPNTVSNGSNGPNTVSNGPNSVSNGSNGPTGVSNGEAVISNQIGVSPGSCKFHGGWGFGGAEVYELPMSGSFSPSFDARMVRNFECPKRFNLTPSMKSLLQRNVNMFAAGFRANKSQVCPSTLSSSESPTVVPAGSELPSEKFHEPRGSKNAEVSSVMSSLGNLSLDDKPDGGISEKGEDLLNLAHRIRDLEGQVKDRKEWAHQKAMQAARKLSHDLTELKMLRMEREETQRLKKGKQTLEDTTMKRLSEMENALRKASGQVDRANTAVRRLENENAEIRAEMEASKLSASESVKTCLEVAKREKKCLKRLLAWEKQKTKLQEEVAEEKQKISQFQQQLLHIKEAQKETEAKWKQEVKNKELAMTQVEEERRSKESTEVNVKRKQEVLRRKVEIDFQRHKDDIERLEQDLSRLRTSAESTQLNCTTNTLAHGDSEVAKPHRETHTRSLNDLSKLQDSSDKGGNYDRECLICMKDEVSVVFLPCAHQVLCANCNEDYGKKGKATCPSCRVQIEQRINVYGASS